ncbi:peptidylprolyl isomerase [Oceanicoccus sp. KOV_DT_Chl]|uniref:foldase protein PrsA n=1 Tax=Oceanicoccus sp. KOV_DT_Chl TaxID=1904639 RepID=UPI000C7AA5FF|nr:peptidylprolyl isomerase [Oceanicoccus sp. KOV_DT_Chl]
MLSFIRQPWLHFLIIGWLLFIIQQQLQTTPRTIIYAPSTEKIAELRGQWLRTTGRVPSEKQVQQLINNEIDREILFQQAIKHEWHLTDTVVRQRLIKNMQFLNSEQASAVEHDERELLKMALSMQLHINDVVVRRRLIQRMEMSAFAPVRNMQPSAQLLEQLYQQQQAQLMKPALVKFQHIFVSRDTHADPKRYAHQLLQDVSTLNDSQQLDSLSDPFLHGFDFNFLNVNQVARYFGVSFAEALFQLAIKLTDDTRWQGPLTSSFGEHLVLITQYRPAQLKTLPEAEKQLISQWRREQEQQALDALLQQLRSDYEVVQPTVMEAMINAQ